MFYNTTPVEADMWILGHMSVCVFIISCLVLDALQNVGCFSFVLSLTSLTLTKFIEKCTNIFNARLVLLKSIVKYILIVHLFGIKDVNYNIF